MTPATTAAYAVVLLVAAVALGGLLVIVGSWWLADRAAKGKCERSCARAYAAYDVPVRVPGPRTGER